MRNTNQKACGAEDPTHFSHFCCAISAPRPPPDTIVAQFYFFIIIHIVAADGLLQCMGLPPPPPHAGVAGGVGGGTPPPAGGLGTRGTPRPYQERKGRSKAINKLQQGISKHHSGPHRSCKGGHRGQFKYQSLHVAALWGYVKSIDFLRVARILLERSWGRSPPEQSGRSAGRQPPSGGPGGGSPKIRRGVWGGATPPGGPLDKFKVHILKCSRGSVQRYSRSDGNLNE